MVGWRLLPVALTSLARKISKIIYFYIAVLVLGRALPRPKPISIMISQEIFATSYSGFVNADTMYDTFFYISLIIVIFLSAVLYIYDIEVNFNDKEQNEMPILRICGLKTMVAQTRKDLLMFRSEKAASKPAYHHPLTLNTSRRCYATNLPGDNILSPAAR